MSELLLPVTERLLTPGGLGLDDLPELLSELAGPGIDAADLYFQDQVTESWVLPSVYVIASTGQRRRTADSA